MEWNAQGCLGFRDTSRYTGIGSRLCKCRSFEPSWLTYSSCGMGSDVFPESHVTIRVYEQHTLGRPCVGSLEYVVSTVDDQLERTLGECFIQSFLR
jgi:hypothetical protein